MRVRILTNSLESSTVLAAQAGYMRYRRPLLESGVELYEIRSLLGEGDVLRLNLVLVRHGCAHRSV